MLSVDVLYIASRDLFHVRCNNQDDLIDLIEYNKQTTPLQGDLSYWITENSLNHNFTSG